MRKEFAIHMLTLSRIPLSFLFCGVLLFHAQPFFPCAALFVLIAATDFFDGRLARKYRLQSDVGAVLDVMSDFFFIASACVVLCFQGLLPVWMLAVILFKFFEFCISSIVLKNKKKSAVVFLFDPLGRGAAVFFYLLPVLVLLLQICVPAAIMPVFLFILCAGITLLAVISSVKRISFGIS